MQRGNDRLGAALGDGERTAEHRTRLGGRDTSTHIISWALDRSYGSDLPPAMRAVSGVSSAQLDVTLTGAGGQSAPALYGPWAPRRTGDVVRPGQSVTHAWGITGECADAFRGTVRARSAESGTDTVRVTALDGAERLRQPAYLPRPDGVLARPVTGPLWSSWAASPVWVVDHLLRDAGIHTAPPPRPTSILYASLHGGVAADIGYLEGANGAWSSWEKFGAPFESAASGSLSLDTATYVPETLPVNRGPRGLWIECWGNTADRLYNDRIVRFQTAWQVAATTTYYATMNITFNTGAIAVTMGTSPDPSKNGTPITWTWNPLKTAGVFHVGWWVTWSESGSPSFTPVITPEGGTPSVLTAGTFSRYSLPPGAMTLVQLGVQNMLAECFQVSQHSAIPSGNSGVTQEGTWKRTASLDVPIFPLRSIPPVSGTAWDVINEIARATLATAEFDADGYFRWRNHTRWTTTPSRADLLVTSARELGALTVTEEIDACRNLCTVKWENWNRVVSGGTQTLWDRPATPVELPPWTEVTRSFSVDEDMMDPRAPQTAYASTVETPGRVVVRTDASPTSAVVGGVVEVSVRRRGGTVTLYLWNSGAVPLYYHGGSLLTVIQSEKSKPAPSLWSAWNSTSQALYGVQSYEHDVAGWVQEGESGRALAEALRNAGSFPPPLLQSVEILPDPRLQLGDVVRVVDTTGAQLDTLAWVVGIQTEGSEGRITQKLTLRGTATNGTPKDAELTPDPPTRPDAPPPP
ncbi:hypothetical protein [Streptomyces sp. NPDC002067]